MHSEINKILKKIEILKKDLLIEYNKLADQYGFIIEERKVVFLKRIRSYNKKFKENLFHYIFTANIRNVLSIPFIYGMIIPLLLLDIFITIYQFFAFPLYGIQKVKRSDFITYDRRFLDYLNMIQKVHCLYCSYANGLLAYAVEIAGRTELYWCPIKHSSRIEGEHQYFKEFADYGDPNGFKEIFLKKNEILENGALEIIGE